MIPDTLDSHKPIFQTAYGDGNVTKAKELLTQAKYTKDNPLKLEVVYPTSSPTRAQIASTLREYAVETLEGIVQIQPQTEESATLFANIGKGSIKPFCWTGTLTSETLTITFSPSLVVPKEL
jgi:peptide/nickel transport system substrate-binding protein